MILATAWWWIPLLMLGVYGENFLPYVETSHTTTDTMSATEGLRGAGDWVAYLHLGEAWIPAGWTVVSSVIVIVCSALAAGLGLAGLARRDMPERRWLVLTAVTVALILFAGYGGAFGAPFHGLVQDWLNGPLVPFRNIYKFQAGLALALVLGLAHLVGIAAESRGARPVPGRRLVPLIALILVLPGLAWPYLNGSILNPGSFRQLPKYWQSTADWLHTYSPTPAPWSSRRPRTASTPGAPHRRAPRRPRRLPLGRARLRPDGHPQPTGARWTPWNRRWPAAAKSRVWPTT